MKAESSGHSARSILKDPECFASLLRLVELLIYLNTWDTNSCTEFD